MIQLDPATTALILVDLQVGIVGRELAPRSGAQTCAAGRALAERFRAAGAKVVLVRVDFAPDFADALRQPVDEPRPAGAMPTGWSELAPGLAQPGDIHIVKRQWGAFYGTELDLQLRRRGIQTVVIGGIATAIGVDSTARQAWERGYAVVIAEDACSNLDADGHARVVKTIFPRISRVAQSGDLTFG